MGEKSEKTGGGNDAECQDKFVKTHKEEKYEDYGYYFFPEREPGFEEPEKSMTQKFKSYLYGALRMKPTSRARCLLNVHKCLTTDPISKLMVNALESQGCDVDQIETFQCEHCETKISGGFDPFKNQVVFCANNAKYKEAICNIMNHELLHAFDKCRAHFNPKNPEHIACTEIRAANLYHCSLLSAYAAGDAYPWNKKLKHQECVKTKALMSLMLVRNVTQEEGREIVEKVFDRCYNDLEPIGRRMFQQTSEKKRAYRESFLYGYVK